MWPNHVLIMILFKDVTDSLHVRTALGNAGWSTILAPFDVVRLEITMKLLVNFKNFRMIGWMGLSARLHLPTYHPPMMGG